MLITEVSIPLGFPYHMAFNTMSALTARVIYSVLKALSIPVQLRFGKIQPRSEPIKNELNSVIRYARSDTSACVNLQLVGVARIAFDLLIPMLYLPIHEFKSCK